MFFFCRLLPKLHQSKLFPHDTSTHPVSQRIACRVDSRGSNAEIACEGSVEASSIYDSTHPASLGVDGDLGTSWLSAGPDADGKSTYVWTGVQEDFIASIVF